MFSRSITDDSKSKNDTPRVVTMTIVSDATNLGVIPMTLEVSFPIKTF